MPITINNLDKKAVGQRLKAVRKQLDFRQKDLAPRLNISIASLSDIESGKNFPRHDTIYNLSLNYNVNIYYLLYGEGEMFQTDSIKRAVESGYYGIHTEFLKEFYRYFNESSLVRYEMMSYFHELLLEKDKLIEKDILLYEKEQSRKY